MGHTNLLIHCNVIRNACSNDYKKLNINFTMKEETLTFFNFILIPLCISIKLSLSLKIGLRLNTSVWYFKVVSHQRGGWVGQKKSKTWWRSTWMVPYQPKSDFCRAIKFFKLNLWLVHHIHTSCQTSVWTYQVHTDK